MKISARCDYACKAVLELATHWPNKTPIQIQTISDNQKIPLKYLPQIMVQLKRMGIADSVRGQRGGYVLTKAPQAISLGKIVREIEGPIITLSNKSSGSTFTSIWTEVVGELAKYLDGITFDDIRKSSLGLDGKVMYSI